MTHVLDDLFATIESRKGADPTTSYTAKLLDGGAPLISSAQQRTAFVVVTASHL